MTAIEFAKEEAFKAGLVISDECTEWVIWEHTGFPCFFTGDPIERFRQQLSEAFWKGTPIQ